MWILEGLGLLSVLSSDETNELDSFCQERVLKKWEKLFNEWDDANSLYFLKKWGVSIYKNIDYVDTHVWEILAEDILWEMAIFWWWWKRNATAIANQDCLLVVIMSFSIKEIADKTPKLLQKIQDIIEHRIMDNKVIASNNKKKS